MTEHFHHRSAESTVDLIDDSAEEVAGPQFEEQVLHEVHDCADGKMVCGENHAKILHKRFEKCESGMYLQAYEEGRIPRLDQLETRLSEALDAVPAKLLAIEECQNLVKLLRGRAAEIRSSVTRYVTSVVEFNALRKNVVLRDGRPEQFANQMQRNDEKRTRNHNGLLTTLRQFEKLLDAAEDQGLIDKKDVYFWRLGDENIIPSSKIPAFSGTAIDNRDAIKMWAMAADFFEQHQKLTETIAAK